MKSIIYAVLEKIRATFTILNERGQVFFDKIHVACDDWMRDFALAFTAYFDRPLDRRWSATMYRFFLFSAFMFPVVCLFIFFAGSYVVLVPVGSSAVINRFGEYNREVESGLHFYIPVIEKYYIVNTMNIEEESFGFVQPYTPPPEVGLNAQDAAVERYERALEQTERDSGAVFAEKGHIFDALGQMQRLPHDYIKKQYYPPSTQGGVEAPSPDTGVVSQDVLVPSEMKMITAGLNIINITWVLQYRIKNARDYLFNSRDVVKNIRDISQAMMSETIGDWAFMDVLGSKRAEIENETKEKIQYWFDQYKIGIEAFQVIVLNALPRAEVVDAFNEVNKARQDMEKTIYAAEMEYLSAIPEASGEAKRTIFEAQAYAVQAINQAKGEVDQFNAIVVEYQKAKQITKDRLYIEAMEGIFRRTPNTIIDQELKGVLPLFTGSNPSGLLNSNLFSQPSASQIATPLP